MRGRAGQVAEFRVVQTTGKHFAISAEDRLHPLVVQNLTRLTVAAMLETIPTPR